MGASRFESVACGDTMQIAFGEAVRQAQYEYGHRGYTGTIAEKDRFINGGTLPVACPIDWLANLLDGYRENPEAALAAAQEIGLEWDAKLIDELATAYDDKWGAAVGFELAEGATEEESKAGLKRYVFVGWASC